MDDDRWRQLGFSFPEGVTMDDVLEFNSKIGGQAQALLNPSMFNLGVKAEPITFDLQGSQKNYLLVPLKLDEAEADSGLTYRIDSETILQMTDKHSGEHTLNRLIQGG